MRKIKSKIKGFIKRRLKDFVLDFYFPRVYAKAAQEVLVDNKVVFVELREPSITNSFRTMYTHLETEYDFDLKIALLKEGRVGLRNYYKNCVAMLREIATAKYVFLNEATSIMGCMKLRPETKIIQLWHGCGAFKKFGMATADLLFGGSREQQLKHPQNKNLSLVTVSSSEVIWAYAEAMILENQKEIIQPLGVSRTDVFFDKEFVLEAREHIDEMIPECANKKVILYAPTFRGRVASATGPDALEIPLMKKALGDEYVLLIKHHPHVKNPPAIPDDCKDFAFLTGSRLLIDELLCRADICITDYSSLVFEYSLFKRPLIFFAYDIDDYNDWRGFFYDYDELTPGPVYQSTQEIIDYLERIDDFDDAEIVAFRDKFMSACDGHAATRICEAVFGKTGDLIRYAKPKAREVLRERNPEGKDLSIIIPAYNAMPEISKTLQSVVDQTYGLERLEVIVVDDGSTDDTWNEIKKFASNFPDLFVPLKLSAPSGSPSTPRNVAIEKAQGEYIFCLDADDWLGSKAVEKMLDHALRWNSDLLLVKMKGEGGRHAPETMFRTSEEEVDVYESRVMWTFAPMKLIKRSLIQQYGIVFPQCMPEDIFFILQVYYYAKKVSVASDYFYYHVAQREGEKSASLSTWVDLNSNLIAYEMILGFIEENIEDSKRDTALMKRLFRREVYCVLRSLIRNYAGAEQARFYADIMRLFASHYRSRMYETSSFDKRVLLDAGMNGNLDLLKNVVMHEDDIAELCTFTDDEKGLYYSFVCGEGTLSGEISQGLSLTCRVEEVQVLGENSLGVSGVMEVSKPLVLLCDGVDVELLVRDKDSDDEVTFMCEYGIKGIVEGKPSLYFMQWKTCIDLRQTHKLHVQKREQSRWHVFLRVSGKSFGKEVRIGSSSSINAEVSFAGFKTCVDAVRYETYLTEYGNYSFLVRRT